MSSTLICDRCGDPIESDVLVLRALSGRLPSRPRWDLCPACARQLARWLAPVGAPAPVETDDEDDEADEAEGD